MTQQASEYSKITEAPGSPASLQQLERLYQRYHFASAFQHGGEVLEIACGTGIGLGYLTRRARRAIGIDIDEKNLSQAGETYRGDPNVSLHQMDAHALQFPAERFELVLLYEAIYYLQDPARCIAEMHRVLKPGGACIICTVNREWPDFHPSPYAQRYLSAAELHAALKGLFSSVDLYGGFPTNANGLKSRIVSFLKRVAVTLDLIPGSLKMRSYLKRLVFGKLVSLPRQLREHIAEYKEPVKISILDGPCKDFTILYAVAMKDPGKQQV